MHTCRLKAGFPTIEIMSAKSEGGVKYMCVSKSNLLIKSQIISYTLTCIHVDVKPRFTQDL